VLIVLGACPARAAGINLSWDDCGEHGAYDKSGSANFSCNTNSSGPGLSAQLVGSYVLGTTITDVVANTMVIELGRADARLVPWGDFQTGRSRQLVAAFRNASTSCSDWPGSSEVVGNLTPLFGFGRANMERLNLVAVFNSGAPQTVTAGIETESFTLTINNAATVGNGSCGGCNTPICIVLRSIVINEFPAHQVPLNLSVPDYRNWVTWFGGSPSCPCIGSAFDCRDPVHHSSWGQVKGMYR
jgi:hypothetical protein